MCRHLAFVGDVDTDLVWLLYDAPHALREQARCPRYQQSGDCNPDGWGVAWYVPGRETPERYRTVTPIWDDDSFPAQVSGLRSRAVVAAGRLASPGAARAETGNAPFVSGRWAFSLNGYVRDFHGGAGDELRARLTRARRDALQGDADSEVLFGLALDRLDDGTAPADALADVVHLVTSLSGGRLNMLLTDGERLAATRFGNSLFHLGSCLLASEPLDDQPAWTEVADGSYWSSWPGGATTGSL